MGLWSYYFFLKLALYFGKYIDFHFWWNLGFALFTLLPAKALWQKFGKQALAVPAGIALLYHDSWLPPLHRALAQKDQLAAFSFNYFMELMGRFIDWRLVAALVAMFAVWSVLSRKLRMSTFALIGIMTAGASPLLAQLQPEPAAATTAGTVAAKAADLTPDALNARLSEFFKTEETRRVQFPQPLTSAVPFDIVYLQICSLAWDDLRYSGSDNHPLLKEFDVLMTQFDGGASYSGPAAIRLLRSGCGQPRHEALYAPAAPECYLYNEFQRIGYEPTWAMNHRGIFGNMVDDITNQGKWTVPLQPEDGLKPVLKSFDAVENGYKRDYDVLSRWWQTRLKNPAPRVALYYNSGTMHDGNKFVDRPTPGSRDSYKLRADMLFGDIEHFIKDIKDSGRHAVVVLVPEHGAALRGDRRQLSGLREIPTPAISQIPVGLKFVGRPDEPQQKIETPVSFLAMNEIISRMLAQDGFGPTPAPLADLVRDLPQTDPVAENDGTVIMQIGGAAMMRTPDGAWTRYDAN